MLNFNLLIFMALILLGFTMGILLGFDGDI